MTQLQRAKQLLELGGHTLVVCGDGLVHSSDRRGVAPMISFLEQGLPLSGCAAADKVVGKATALLFILAGIREVYAVVLSKPAKAALERHGVAVTYGTLTERIENRDKTGLCPMEQAVWDIDDPELALAAVKAKLAELRQR